MTKVICSRVLTSLRKLGVAVGRGGQSQTRSCQCFRYSFEGDNGYTVCQTNHGADGATKGVTGNPDIGIRIKLSDVTIELSSSLVVPVFVAQGHSDTSVIAAVGPCGTVTNLPIRPLSLLRTATTEEKIVIDFVICCCSITIKNGGRGAFQADDDGGVRLVSPYVPAEPVRLPAEIGRSVKRLSYLIPVRQSGRLDVCVRDY